MAKMVNKLDNPRKCLRNISLDEHYSIVKQLGYGAFGKAVLAKCYHTNAFVVLKLVNKITTSWKDFHREFNLSYFLSPHPCIVNTFDVAFQTQDLFLFAQEFAILGDLYKIIKRRECLSELQTKHVIRQITCALEYMHSEDIVHRDVKPENVLVFAEDFSRVKLADFGLSRKKGTVIRKVDGYAPYSPPEIADAVRHESVVITKSEDSWALGILIYTCLTGKFAWSSASSVDFRYRIFRKWQKRKSNAAPHGWQYFSCRLMKLFRKLFEPKHRLRATVNEVHKYMDDCWVFTRKDSQVTLESNEVSVGAESGTSDLCHLDDQEWRENRLSQWVLQLSI